MALIRTRGDEDVDECVALLQRVHDKEGYPRGTTNFKNFLTHAVADAWVAELDSKIVGHVAVSAARDSDFAVSTWRRVHTADSNTISIVERLFVDPDARRAGTAAALLETAASNGRASGQRLVLFALVANQAAIRLYRRLGWEEYGTGSWRFGENLEKEMDAICFASPATV